MSKDYAKKQPSKTNRNKQQTVERPSLVMWIIAFALIGLFIVGLIYLHQLKPKTTSEKNLAPLQQGHATKPQNKVKFEFYTSLPQNNEKQTTPTNKTAHSIAPVIDLTHKQPKSATPEAHKTSSKHEYLLQIASFKHYQDADDTKAKLLLAGFNANVEKVKIKDTIWYRVLIGPYTDLKSIKEIQNKLTAKHIQSLRINVEK